LQLHFRGTRERGFKESASEAGKKPAEERRIRFATERGERISRVPSGYALHTPMLVVMLRISFARESAKMCPMKNRSEDDIISQTRDLYNRMADEARRSVERDQEMIRQSRPLTKILLGVCVFASLIAAATMVYGMITFPDAPIRQTASGYIGKAGQPHTGDEYEQFKLWEKVMITSFGLTFLSGAGALLSGKSR
jgi:hypothetical protein